MEFNEGLYAELIQLRDKLKAKAERKHKVFNCNDSTIREIAKLQPVKISDFAGITGVGPVFMDNYASYFIEIVKKWTSTPENEVKLNKKGISILQDYEKKLVNLNKRNHLLYCGKLYGKFGVDLKDAQNDIRNIILGNCRGATIAKTGDKNYNQIISLVRSNNRNLREKGQNNLFVGYPFVRGFFASEDFNVRAPLALFPIKAEKNGTGIKISVDSSREVLFNTTLILANFKFNNINKPLPDSEIEDRTKDGFIQSLVEFYSQNKMQIEIPENETDELKAFENYTSETFPKMKKGEFVLENSAVLGIFPICSSSIQRDFQLITESKKINKLLNDLLDNTENESLENKLFEDEVKTDISEKEICYINNLDAAQEKVIADLHDNDELVVQGPPGTGKSQTITSLIADFAIRDKSVLLVSEKKTALDVVYSRLGNLSKYALILDDVNDKEAFYSQLANLVSPVKLEETSGEDILLLENNIDEQVGQLNQLSEIFYKKDEFGIEPYKLYLLIEPEEILKKENIKKQRKLADALGEDYKKFTYFDSINGKKFFSKQNSVLQFDNFSFSLKKYFWFVKTKANLTDFEIQSMNIDYEKIQEDAEKRNELKFFKKLFSKNEVKADIKEFFAKYFDFTNDTKKYDEAFKKLLSSDKELERKSVRNIKKILGKRNSTQKRILLNYFCKNTEDLYMMISEYELFWRAQNFYFSASQEIQDYYWAIKKIIPTCKYFQKDDSVKDMIKIANEELSNFLPAKHLMDLEIKSRDKLPTIERFEEILKKIDSDMDSKRKLEKNQLEKVLAERAAILSNSKRRSEILKAIESKRKWSVHKFFDKYNFELFNSIKIWLLTPEVVSEILPLETGLFDLVVFDEASQMFVEKGIPSILRGNKIVVAGDQKQLRPSSLGVGRFVLDEDEIPEDEELSPAQDEDSLLDLARFKYNRTMLNFHYRSSYEELIAFSNYAFYGGKLYVSPNTSIPENPPIEVHKMENALWTNRYNEKEAEYIVELLKKFFAERKNNETVGIITFNSNQRDKIDDFIDKECDKDPEFAAQINAEIQRKKDGEDIGLFVKNIETVQGDERDVIIFSMGYGFNEAGKFIQNFGWLNQSGGENRLNVAVSRAKKKVHIVVSFDPSEIKEGKAKNGGPALLKKYLEYAFAVSDRDSERAKLCLESLLSAEDQELLSAEASENKDEKIGAEEKVKSEEISDEENDEEKTEEVTDENSEEISEEDSTEIEQEISVEDELEIAQKKFEDEIYNSLVSRGYEVDRNIGIGGYSIDFAVKKNGLYVLGIECDSRLYKNSDSARERDYYRQKYLESRGWRIFRLWSIMWKKNPDKVMKKINQLLKNV